MEKVTDDLKFNPSLKEPKAEKQEKKEPAKPHPLTLDMLNFQSNSNPIYRTLVNAFSQANDFDSAMAIYFDTVNVEYGDEECVEDIFEAIEAEGGLKIRAATIGTSYGSGLNLVELAEHFNTHYMLLLARYEKLGADVPKLLKFLRVETWCYHGYYFNKEDLERKVGLKFDDFMCDQPKSNKAKAIKLVINRGDSLAYGTEPL